MEDVSEREGAGGEKRGLDKGLDDAMGVEVGSACCLRGIGRNWYGELGAGAYC